ncbi:cytochrome C oxidase subunit II [Halobacillus locisalis]|uniref:Cytochrome C oxidase subunit II n=1 Tax=Halobacillus locisalis TaxID=220753 RepID=A0A838CT04_9BACI|nr:cytochrome C oxidase subunit II [Halobacillus locisalis]MBA2174993.1 cytochrome C oxidase subunit II [Halobacillus locisalis]
MKKPQQQNLKGTLISVFFVGGIIIFMWVSVYFLYVSRL